MTRRAGPVFRGVQMFRADRCCSSCLSDRIERARAAGGKVSVVPAVAYRGEQTGEATAPAAASFWAAQAPAPPTPSVVPGGPDGSQPGCESPAPCSQFGLEGRADEQPKLIIKDDIWAQVTCTPSQISLIIERLRILTLPVHLLPVCPPASYL